MKPTVFVGSSTEQLDLALAVQIQLQRAAEVTVWDQDVFALTQNTLESLLYALDGADFGIFVFYPEDMVKIREHTMSTTRDNVIFEFGLFMGRLGRERTFFLAPNSEHAFRLPTDLSGITPAIYDATRIADNIQAAVAPACFKMQQAIKKCGVRQNRLRIPEIERIVSPNILCAASAQWAHLDFAEDAKLIKATFSDRARVETNLTADTLGELALCNTFDIVHLVAYVDPKNGHLVFSHVDRGYRGDLQKLDHLSPEAFAKIIDLCKTKLVVLATCDCLLLGTKLARTTNMIAASQDIDLKIFWPWEKAFYTALAKGHSIARAFEVAKSLTNAPMELLLKTDCIFDI
jgi:hypothetical protein